MIVALTAALFLFQPAEPEIPQAIHNAFETWTECLDERLQQSEQRRNATRMADAALRACREHERSFTSAFDQWLPTAGLNAEQMRAMRSAFREQIRGMRPQTIAMAQSYVEEE